MSFKVIDSSLCVTVPFPVFLTKHSCVHSEWRLEEEDKSYQLWAVSYKLLVISCELKAEAYFPLGVIRNNSKGFAVVVRGALIVIRSKCEGSVPVVRTSARRHSERQRRIYCRDKEDGKCHPRNGEAGWNIPQQPKKKLDLPRRREVYGRIGKNRKA